MWKAVSRFILRFRITLLILVGLLTIFFGYKGTQVEKSQEFARVVPKDDPDYQNFLKFKQLFGEDANTIIIGLKAENFFTPARLNAIQRFVNQTRGRDGVKEVLSITSLYRLTANDSLKIFQAEKLLDKPVQTQAQADSLREKVTNLPFYQGLILNEKGTTTVVAVTITKAASNSKQKHALVAKLKEDVERLAEETGMEYHLVGLPYIRSYMSTQIASELNLFMALAILFTAACLFLFYRSFYAVIFPLILLCVASLVTLGLITLLGYQLTTLSALLPPIIVILGIPPSIYMLSDYHDEYKKYGHKRLAISKMVRKLGLVTFMINANTAFGFLTLYFTQVTILQEFGLVAFLATMMTYVLTMVIIPGVFSLLPPPTDKNLRHLDAPHIVRIVRLTDKLVQHRRRAIYWTTLVIFGVAIAGCFKLQAVSYMVDDLPKQDRIRKDLNFLEENFHGVMPFEIVIDTRQAGALKKLRYLKKIEALQDSLKKYPQLGRTLSLVDVMKWSRQAYLGGDAEQYKLPARDELAFLADYAENTRLHNRRAQAQAPAGQRDILHSLVDSSYQVARITGYVQDMGSLEMPVLIEKIQADIDAVFEQEQQKKSANTQPLEHFVTGTTAIFLKANEYLVDNLFWSLLATFVLIGLQMWLLFGSVRIMLISLVPNLIPLVVTAGLMGYLGIALKPSTALIYELAFGIAIDNSIHYLAMYRHKRRAGLSIPGAVGSTLRVTGMSIIYTSIVLFMGFVIFTPSTFGSTQALGILTSITLFMATFSNLLLMPALLVSFDRDSTSKGHALIDDADEEDDDPEEATAHASGTPLPTAYKQ
ncbi:MAG: MMPL family transporter [Bacteroidetes bacterium]|jgi:predicted RND superfamily exporter protein|nr:MMPL family transporter [Bacteroidota bacterium]